MKFENKIQELLEKIITLSLENQLFLA